MELSFFYFGHLIIQLTDIILIVFNMKNESPALDAEGHGCYN